MYSRFVMVLNEKKAKIRELQYTVRQLSHTENQQKDEGRRQRYVRSFRKKFLKILNQKRWPPTAFSLFQILLCSYNILAYWKVVLDYEVSTHCFFSNLYIKPNIFSQFYSVTVKHHRVKMAVIPLRSQLSSSEVCWLIETDASKLTKLFFS